MQAVVRECVAVAQAEGVEIPADIDDTVRRLAGSMPDQRSSNAQDLALGKRSEIDHLNGLVVRRGRPTGCRLKLGAKIKKLLGRTAGEGRPA